MLESKIQEMLANEIRENDGSLACLISEVSYDNLLRKKKDIYGMNDIISQRYISSVETVMDLVSCEGKIICDDGKKNISMNSSETLRPDFVIYNEEDDAYIIVELKVSANAERQAVTEVMAYQLELRNYLPGLSNYNIPIVIISQDYRPLLKHAIFSMLMENQNVLCLSVNEDALMNGRTEEVLEIVDCDTWSEIKWECRKDSLVGYTLSFYKIGEQSYSDKEMENIISMTTVLISTEAEKVNSNGFAIAWKFKNADGFDKESFYMTDYFVTYFCVDPYKNYVESVENTIMNKHIMYVKREGVFKELGAHFFLDKVKKIFNRNFDILYECGGNFEQFIFPREIDNRILLKVASWGIVHEFILDMLKNNPLFIDNVPLDIFNPKDFLKCFSILCGDVLQFDSLDDCFKFGQMESSYHTTSVQIDCYSYTLYRLSSEVWNRLSVKTSKMISLYEYGKKYGQIEYIEDDDYYIISDCKRAFDFWAQMVFNESKSDFDRKEVIENCLFGYQVQNHICNYMDLDEEDENLDEKCEETILNLYNSEEKKSEIINFGLDKMIEDSDAYLSFIKYSAAELIIFYSYYDLDNYEGNIIPFSESIQNKRRND